jgi:hypothetical protein
MTDSDSTKQQPVQASAASHADHDDEGIETPMMAVWLSLGAILVAGLYGVYLGTSAKSKSNADAPTHSLFSAPDATAQRVG